MYLHKLKKEKKQGSVKYRSVCCCLDAEKKKKLIPDIVGHVPCKIARFISFFCTHGGKMEASILSIRQLPSSIPSGGLEIMLKS